MKKKSYYYAAMMAISIDTAMHEHFANKPVDDPDPERRAARCRSLIDRSSQGCAAELFDK